MSYQRRQKSQSKHPHEGKTNLLSPASHPSLRELISPFVPRKPQTESAIGYCSEEPEGQGSGRKPWEESERGAMVEEPKQLGQSLEARPQSTWKPRARSEGLSHFTGHKKKVTHACCNPSTWKVELGGLGVQG